MEDESQGTATAAAARPFVAQHLDRKALAILLLAMVGAAASLYATWLGVGVSTDSVTYTSSARQLLVGHGLIAPGGDGRVLPLTRFAPLYPAILAAAAWPGSDVLAAARHVAALLFAANVLLVGLIIRRYASPSLYPSLLGSTLMLSAVDMLTIHSMAWSEPLFLVLGFLGLALLGEYLESRRLRLLLASGGATALAMLTRYAGPPLVIAELVGLALWGPRNRRERCRDTFVFGAISCIPFALWFARNTALSGSVARRPFVYHPMSLRRTLHGVLTLSRWLWPAELPEVARGVLVLVVGAGAILLGMRSLAQGRRRSGADAPLGLALLGIFIAAYASFLVVSISFFDALTPLDGRILAPVYVAGLILALSLAHRWLGPLPGKHPLRIACLAASLAIVGSYVITGAAWARRVHRNGQGYTSLSWQESPTVARIGLLPADRPIYSNRRDAVYFLTGRLARGIPRTVNPITARPNDGYWDAAARMREQMAATAGYLVLFRSSAEESDLLHLLPLQVVAQELDGTVYEISP